MRDLFCCLEEEEDTAVASLAAPPPHNHKNNHTTNTTMTNRLQSEIRHQIRTAVPTLCSMTLNKIPWMISLRFVGAVGAAELAAAALATTIFNVTGLSLSVGLSSALTTLTGQARGELQAREREQRRRITQELLLEKDEAAIPFDKEDGEDEREVLRVMDQQEQIETIGLLRASGAANTAAVDHCSGSSSLILPLVYLYRGLFIQLLFVLPVGLWWLSGTMTERTLTALGQGATLSQMTADYLRILAPGLWAYSINWTVTAWLQALEMADVPACAAAVGLIAHLPLNYLFVDTLDQGYLGCAMATVTYQLLQPVLVLLYLCGSASRTRPRPATDPRAGRPGADAPFVAGQLRGRGGKP